MDYQAARLWQLTDGNGIVRQTLFDPLGDVLARSVFKPAAGQRPRSGDMDLRDYQVQTDATFASVLADRDRYLQGAATFHLYDRSAWLERRSPAAVMTVTGTQHVSDSPGPPRPCETEISYTDGRGRLAERLRHAEPASDASSGSADPPGGGQDRWIVSGHTTYTADGLPVREYLPYYAAAPDFAPPPASPPPRVLHYDAFGRRIRVDEPQGFFTRTAYAPWERRDYDEDDTVLDLPHYQEFMASYPPAPDPGQQAEKTPWTRLPGSTTRRRSRFSTMPGSRSGPSATAWEIPPDVFAAIVTGSEISSRQLWDQLHDQGYLVTTSLPAPHTRVADRFQPYTQGFALQLAPPYAQFAAAATAVLLQACLTSGAAFDQQARLVRAVDPRLYYSNVQVGAALASAEYSYSMGQPDPALSQTADRGPLRLLGDARGRVVSAWNGRGLRQDRTFDGLDRAVLMTVQAAGGTARTLETVTHGEHQPDAADANLIGRAYQVKDESGTLVMSEYTISGLPAVQHRQYARDYSTEPDWSGEVALDPQLYDTALRYDALGRLVERVTPDGSVLTVGYHVSGRLAWLRVAQTGAVTSYLAGADYNAAGQRLRSRYGNGAEQVSVFDEATGRLAAIVTQASGFAPVQQVAYTYDPAGNVTRARDRTAELALGVPQPEPAGEYTYDALYRLRRATGIQHLGIAADIHATGFKQTLLAQLPAAGPATVTLEPYTETYTYDDAGNLIGTDHMAPSGSFTRATPVTATSNQLAGIRYDSAGHLLSLQITGDVTLIWDTRGNLAATSPVPRPDGSTEQSWFCYDRSGERSRKVVERRNTAGQVTETADARYVGSYVDRRVITLAGPGRVPAGSTLRVQDGSGRPIAVVEFSSADRQARYQIRDLLGSASVELGSDASVLSYEGFFPGGGSSVIVAASTAAAEPKVLRYSGQEADDSTGLYYYGGRYLAPWLGRWLSADPAGPADGLNLYAFVHGNPVSLIDIGGHETDDPNRPAQGSVSRFLQALGPNAARSFSNTPTQVGVLGPTALYYQIIDALNRSDPTEHRNRNRNWTERAEESRVTRYAYSAMFGVDLEQFLADFRRGFANIFPSYEGLLGLSPAWTEYGGRQITTALPPDRQRVLQAQLYLRDQMRRPEYWAGIVGGSLCAAPVSLTLRLVLWRVSQSGTPVQRGVATMVTYSPFYFGWMGNAAESDLVFASNSNQTQNSQNALPRTQCHNAYVESDVARHRDNALPALATAVVGEAVGVGIAVVSIGGLTLGAGWFSRGRLVIGIAGLAYSYARLFIAKAAFGKAAADRIDMWRQGSQRGADTSLVGYNPGPAPALIRPLPTGALSSPPPSFTALVGYYNPLAAPAPIRPLFTAVVGYYNQLAAPAPIRQFPTSALSPSWPLVTLPEHQPLLAPHGSLVWSYSPTGVSARYVRSGLTFVQAPNAQRQLIQSLNTASQAADTQMIRPRKARGAPCQHPATTQAPTARPRGSSPSTRALTWRGSTSMTPGRSRAWGCPAPGRSHCWTSCALGSGCRGSPTIRRRPKR